MATLELNRPALVVVGRGPSGAGIADAAAALDRDLVVVEPHDLARAPAGAVTVLDADAPGVEPAAAVHALATRTETLVVATRPSLEQVHALFEAGATDVVATPLHKRELILRLGAALQQRRRIACLGGGTGLFSVLTGLKELQRVLLSSIVSMSDDGGSSGRLRIAFGVLPPGDVRRSLVALSNAPELMNHLIGYRFSGGDALHGHSLGNLILTALSEMTGGMPEAVRALGDVLNVQGVVLGVSETATTLCAEFADGRVVRGESAIDRCLDRPGELRVRRVWHEPPAQAPPDVCAALLAADTILIGPGDLYTSVVAGLRVDGVADAVRRSRARKVYVCNLMTKPGETAGYDVADHVQAVVLALGGDALDRVLVSSTVPDPDAVARYAAMGQRPVAPEGATRAREVTAAEIVACDLGDRALLVRHDGAKLAREVERLLEPRRRAAAAPAREPGRG